MGTWPIYKALPTTDLNKKKPFHLIKYLLTTFIFSFLFNLYLFILLMISQCGDAPKDGLCQVSNQSYKLADKHTVSTETVAFENSIETLQMSHYANIVMQSFSFNILDIGGNDNMFNDIRKCLQILPSLMDEHCFLYSIVKSCHSQLTPSCDINCIYSQQNKFWTYHFPWRVYGVYGRQWHKIASSKKKLGCASAMLLL